MNMINYYIHIVIYPICILQEIYSYIASCPIEKLHAIYSYSVFREASRPIVACGYDYINICTYSHLSVSYITITIDESINLCYN